MTERLAERQKRLVRAEIAQVAIGLFADSGFDAVTVDDIASAAGVSPRTFFRYFATKGEVVLDYKRHLDERLVTVLEDRPPSEGPVTALREAYRVTSQVPVEDRARVVQLGRILGATPTLRAMAHGERLVDTSALEAAVARRLGSGAADARARTIVAAMGSVAATEFHAWVASGGDGDPADRITAALALLEAGLGQLDWTPGSGTNPHERAT